MKKILVFIFSLFSLIQCTENNTKNSSDATLENQGNDSLMFLSKKNLFSFLDVPAQTFTITNLKDTVIMGKKGTKISIPKNCFNGNGNKQVEITLKEYYSYKDFLAENLFTVSNGRQLESNGMIYLSAKCDNKEVKLKKKKSITVGFLKNKAKKDFGLFYGTKDSLDNINWQADFTRSESSKAKSGIRYLNYEKAQKGFRIATYGSPTEFSIDNLDLLNFKDEKYGDVLNYLESKFTFNLKEAIPFPSDESVNLYFTLNKEGKLVYESADFSYNTPLKKKLVDFFKQLPNLKPYVNNEGKTQELPVYYTIQPNQALGDFLYADSANVNLVRKIKVQNEENQREKEREENAKAQKKSDSINTVYAKINSVYEDFNSLSVTKLGWINCDRFLYDPNEKIEFVIENEASDFQARLVFKDIKSMMKASLNSENKFCFSNIPANKNIRVVAIRIVNLEPYIAIAETNTNVKGCKLDFKKYSKKEAEKLFEDL